MDNTPSNPAPHYRPFLPFSEWAGCVVDEKLIDARTERLDELKKTRPEVLRKALTIVRRVAAIETGAVEGLYETDRGFTITVAAQAATVENALATKTKRAQTLIQDQLAAYEHVLDFATSMVPIVEAWIRELHRDLCTGQQTYVVQTGAGPQSHELPLGTYKTAENHVRTADGGVHAYAPVAETAREMERLVTELKGDRFRNAHPMLQASYCHHGLVVIHPFADGNGRVARALASVFTYRAYSLPVLIMPDNRTRYFDALADADSGNCPPFVAFITDRLFDALELVTQSIQSATAGDGTRGPQDLAALYKSIQGYHYEQLDQMAQALMAAFETVLREASARRADDMPELDAHVGWMGPEKKASQEGHRLPAGSSGTGVFSKPGQRTYVRLDSRPPADATVTFEYHAEIPFKSEAGERIQIVGSGNAVVYSAPIADIARGISDSTRLALSIAVEGALDVATGELAKQAALSLKSKGH